VLGVEWKFGRFCLLLVHRSLPIERRPSHVVRNIFQSARLAVRRGRCDLPANQPRASFRTG
jgi:hypothetical protein